jgi:DUF1365 family protein
MPERRSHAAAAGAALALLLLPLLPVAIDGGRGRGGSALYEGRVWHTRLRPARHSFTYPIFFAFVDVDEPELFPWYWWPLASGSRLLPAIVKFDERDHLKDRGLGNSPSLSEALRQRQASAHSRGAGSSTSNGSLGNSLVLPAHHLIGATPTTTP